MPRTSVPVKVTGNEDGCSLPIILVCHWRLGNEGGEGSGSSAVQCYSSRELIVNDDGIIAKNVNLSKDTTDSGKPSLPA